MDTKILPEHIATEQPVVHPALDWRDGVLMMGVILGDASRVVLTSGRELIPLNGLPFPICDRSRNFGRSPVTEKVGKSLMDGYGLPEKGESAYLLATLPTGLAAYYRRFVVFPEPWWPEVLALWTLGTYLYPIFNAYPYLRISSPEPGCGKSLLGELIAKLSFNGELMVSPTEANIFRLAESERGTQVWDEVENQSESEHNRLQSLKGVLLNGYRSGATVVRQERTGKQFHTVRFHVYVPRVLIGLSELPLVVQQRTIELVLHRRSSDEKVERYFHQKQADEELHLREMCALYALTYCRSVSDYYSTTNLPEALEVHLGQAGRLPDDLLLPLLAVCSAPIDVARDTVLPRLTTLIFKVAPALASNWNEDATATPPWLSATLDELETSSGPTPEELSDRVSKRTGVPISSEQLSKRLAKYGIRSTKRGGKRIFLVSPEEIARIRARYAVAAPEQPKLLEMPPAGIPAPPEGQLGQLGQLGQQEEDLLPDRSGDIFRKNWSQEEESQ